MAPRPLLLVSATGDWTANTPRVEYPAIRRICELYGAADNLESVQIDAPHNYNQASREAVYAFLARHLARRPTADPSPSRRSGSGRADRRPTVPEVATPDEPDEVLRVFPDHEPLPDDALNAEGVRAALAARARGQLAAAWPRAGPDLERLRDGLGSAYQELLALRPPTPDDLVVRRTEEHTFERVRCARLVFGT